MVPRNCTSLAASACALAAADRAETGSGVSPKTVFKRTRVGT